MMYDLPTRMHDSEKERARLRDLYADMPLERLQKLAADPGSLTEIALTSLQAELRRRGFEETISEEVPMVEPREETNDQSSIAEGTEEDVDTSQQVVISR